MKRTIIFLSLAVALLATSCHIKYEQPEVPQEALIRHYNPADSTFNVAELSWREFYKDSLLCDLIGGFETPRTVGGLFQAEQMGLRAQS